MSGDIVKYHNDFNQVYLGRLNSGELNLLFDIIARVKEKGTKELIFTAEELKANLPKNYTKHEFSNLMYSLRRKFFKVDFTIILDVPDRPDLEEERTINLFRRLSIFKDSKTKEVDHVIIQVDEFFKRLVNDLNVNFTRFELEEVFQIRGSYAKKLFRLLKQYRSTGKMVIGLDEFCTQLSIPEGYSQTNINKRVLNPAIEELSEERTVDGRTRPTFKNLKFKKLTSPGSGRKITAISFTFEPDGTQAARKKPKAKAAQQACPYAEGSPEWYIWHHLPLPSQDRTQIGAPKGAPDFQLEPQRQGDLLPPYKK